MYTSAQAGSVVKNGEASETINGTLAHPRVLGNQSSYRYSTRLRDPLLLRTRSEPTRLALRIVSLTQACRSSCADAPTRAAPSTMLSLIARVVLISPGGSLRLNVTLTSRPRVPVQPVPPPAADATHIPVHLLSNGPSAFDNGRATQQASNNGHVALSQYNTSGLFPPVRLTPADRRWGRLFDYITSTLNLWRSERQIFGTSMHP